MTAKPKPVIQEHVKGKEPDPALLSRFLLHIVVWRETHPPEILTQAEILKTQVRKLKERHVH